MGTEQGHERPDTKRVRVVEVTLGHSAWYWVHHGGQEKLRFWMHQGRLLLGEGRLPVGVNLTDLEGIAWAAMATEEELPLIRTLKATSRDATDLLGRFPGLEALECSGLSNKQLAWLCGLGQPLRFLSLSWCDELNVITPLARLKTLVRLMLSDCPRMHNIRHIGELTGLERLDMINCDGVQDLSPLQSLKRLKRLVLRNCDQVSDLEPVASIQGLTSLDVSRCDDIRDISPLAGMKRLASLDLSDCNHIDQITPLESLESLQDLSLFGCENIKDIQSLYRVHDLRELNLPPHVTNEDLAAVCASHTHLRRLHLRDCANITDLKPISVLKELAELSLAGCEYVYNLGPLAGLEDLARLDMAVCAQVTDLSPLDGLKRLEDLYVGGCRGLEPEEIERFKEASPQCTVHDT